MYPTTPLHRRRTSKTRITGKRYWIETRDQGQDLHVLIGRRDGSGVKGHFVIDAHTAEIRVEDQRAVPEELIQSIESQLSLHDGKTVRFTREVGAGSWSVASTAFPSDDSYLASLPGFGASVLQTGGVGSHLTTRRAWLITEHGYLAADDMLSHYFTGGGDFLVTVPREGFVIRTADSPTGNDVELAEDGSWCRLFLKDQLKNEVILQCTSTSVPVPDGWAE